MARFGKGKISKARNKLKRDKKKQGITRYLKTFEVGDKAAIVLNSSSQNYPHPKFHGFIGKIKEKRGDSYILDIKTGNKKKDVIVTPEHLKKVK